MATEISNAIRQTSQELIGAAMGPQKSNSRNINPNVHNEVKEQGCEDEEIYYMENDTDFSESQFVDELKIFGLNEKRKKMKARHSFHDD